MTVLVLLFPDYPIDLLFSNRNRIRFAFTVTTFIRHLKIVKKKLCLIFVIVFVLRQFFSIWYQEFESMGVSSTKYLSLRPKIPPQQIFVYKSHKIQDKMNYCRIDYTKSTEYHSKMTFQKWKKSEKITKKSKMCRENRLHPLTKFHSNESRVHDYATATFFSFSWIQYKIF